MSTDRNEELKLAAVPATAGPSKAKTTQQRDPASENSPSGMWVGTLGVLFAAAFYAVVYAVPWAPLQRYFLGHPVAVAATVLFWIAISILLNKWIRLSGQSSQLETIRDEDLMPAKRADSLSPANEWAAKHNAGLIAKNWLVTLSQLPFSTRTNPLIGRLNELLIRQSQRGTSKHLADDLRELSARDSDAVHDSYSLVRIIVWAIPMLGFLGTVIGITQTLGGLDFTDGTAAVDRLKSGLYVAFDTTALGIVLSVVAIFLQFPVERGEQEMLATIDSRVNRLVSTCLPSDDANDSPTSLITDLCEGIRVAVAESLAQQTELWRSTIDAAHERWQDIHHSTSTQITDAFSNYLSPALREHAAMLDESARVSADRMDKTARVSADRLEETSRASADRIEQQYAQWQTTMAHHSDRMLSTQQTLLNQCDALASTTDRADELAALQTTLDANLARLQETNLAIDRSVAAAAGDGMADAMRILARAVDVLSTRMVSTDNTSARASIVRQTIEEEHASRRAA